MFLFKLNTQQWIITLELTNHVTVLELVLMIFFFFLISTTAKLFIFFTYITFNLNK